MMTDNRWGGMQLAMLRGWSCYSSSFPTMAPLNKFDVIVDASDGDGDGDGNGDGDGDGDGEGDGDGDGPNFRLCIMIDRINGW